MRPGRIWPAALAALTAVALAAPAVARATEVTNWNRIATNTLVAFPGPAGGAPPALQINMAMTQGAVYDAVNAIERRHQPYLLRTRFHPKASKDAAVATAGIGVALVERYVAAPLRERASTLEEQVRVLTDELGERDELRAELAQQDEELATLEETVESNAELLRFLRTPGLHSVALIATDRQPNATARVFWEWEDYACHLHASGLRPPAAERVYVLWVAGNPFQ